MCVSDAFLMDFSSIAQHYSVDLSLNIPFQFLEVIISIMSSQFPLSYLYIFILDLVDFV